jgi:hypothetical protein
LAKFGSGTVSVLAPPHPTSGTVDAAAIDWRNLRRDTVALFAAVSLQPLELRARSLAIAQIVFIDAGENGSGAR